MTLTPIHHAMARAMPVSGGCPVRRGDRIELHAAIVWQMHVVRAWFDPDLRGILWVHDGWRRMPIVPAKNDRVLPAPRVPPSGGFGRLAR